MSEAASVSPSKETVNVAEGVGQPNRLPMSASVSANPDVLTTHSEISQKVEKDVTESTTKQTCSQAPNPTEEELIEEIKNFDNLLKMFSVYRDNPDLRGNPGDRNIEEIAKVLSNFVGDDPDTFLRDSDDDSQDEDDDDDEEGDASDQETNGVLDQKNGAYQQLTPDDETDDKTEKP